MESYNNLTYQNPKTQQAGYQEIVDKYPANIISHILYPNKAAHELSLDEKEKVSDIASIAGAMAGSIAGGGEGIADAVTGGLASKNAVENNALSWGDGGMDLPIPVAPTTGDNMDSILHANNLTREEAEKALQDLIKGKDMPNGSDYVELWMRAPEQISALLPGLISTAMGILAMGDSYLTETDKADLVSVLNKAIGDYLSGTKAESLQHLNSVLNRLGIGSTDKQLQGLIKEKAENNVAKSQKGNKSSNFNENAKKEQEVNAGKGTTKYNISHLTAEQQQIIKNAENISTAKPGKQVTTPRDLNEQIFWKQVETNPSQGSKLPGMNNDPRFPESAGFQKMQATHQLPDGSNITIHYQYNSNTGKAYDMKIDSVQPKWLQLGISIKE